VIDEIGYETNVISMYFFGDFDDPTTPLPIAFNFQDIYAL
jgi:hypothetical protein